MSLKYGVPVNSQSKSSDDSLNRDEISIMVARLTTVNIRIPNVTKGPVSLVT